METGLGDKYEEGCVLEIHGQHRRLLMHCPKLLTHVQARVATCHIFLFSYNTSVTGEVLLSS